MKTDNMGDWVEKISYVPDRAKYEAQQAIFKDRAAEASLPEGFPARLSSEMVWDSDSISLDERCFVNDERCVLHLSKEQLGEIHDALQTFKCKRPLKVLMPATEIQSQLSTSLSDHSIQPPSPFHLSTLSFGIYQTTFIGEQGSQWCAASR